MPEVTGETCEDARIALRAAIELRCALAFSCDCRLALRMKPETGLRCDLPSERLSIVLEYDYVVLSPGETVPSDQGWIIYEDRNGVAMGRTA